MEESFVGRIENWSVEWEQVESGENGENGRPDEVVFGRVSSRERIKR
jgi:hypothetical protein